ncbi:MAG: FtsX-like permease family protein [Candidatus Moraniibacteriota bacterium]
MFIIDNVKLATRTFRTRKLRTFLTVLGIGVGIGAILFLVSLGYGMQRVLLEKITKLDTLLTLDVNTPDASVVKLDQDLVNSLTQLPNVSEVSPLRTVMSNCKFGEVSSQVNFSAVSSDYFRLGGVELLSGDVYNGNHDNKVVLSQGALISLGIADVKDALGKDIKITLVLSPQVNDKTDNKEASLIDGSDVIPLEETFTISGVIDDEANSFGFIPIGWTDNLGISSYDNVKVKVVEQSFLENTRNAIIERGLSVVALSDTIDQANKIFSVIQIVLALFGLVALAVSAIGMFNTMTIALLERTNEIGIMKAIGASNRDVQFLFLTESILIGLFGGLSGLAIGLGGTSLVNAAFNVMATRLDGQAMDIFYTPMWFIIFIISFSTMIGFLTGVYPARRASKLNPLMALRYK